jgi:hypothetical protein
MCRGKYEKSEATKDLILFKLLTLLNEIQQCQRDHNIILYM